MILQPNHLLSSGSSSFGYPKAGKNAPRSSLGEELAKHAMSQLAIGTRSSAIPNSSSSNSNSTNGLQDVPQGFITTNKTSLATPLSSRDSELSMVSSTSSSSFSTTESDGYPPRDRRRKIFSGYWQKNMLPASGIRALARENPRSPLIEHYPSKESKIIVEDEAATSQNKERDDGSSSPVSTTLHPQGNGFSYLHTTKTFAIPIAQPPSRRSIFGDGAVASYSSADDDSLASDLDGFFSRHAHMTVLSSSLDDDCGNDPISTSEAWGIRHRRRPRSYSCTDASLAAPSAAATRRPLISCLKRHGSTAGRRRHSYHKAGLDGSATAGSSSSSAAAAPPPPLETIESSSPLPPASHPEHEENNNKSSSPRDMLVRQPSVTFDSQVEIVAFEPAVDYENENNTNESWTNHFGGW